MKLVKGEGTNSGTNGSQRNERLKFDVTIDGEKCVFVPSWSYQKLTAGQVRRILCEASIGACKNVDSNGAINFMFTSEKTGNQLGFLNGIETSLNEDSDNDERKNVIGQVRELLCTVEEGGVERQKNAAERQGEITDEFGE